MIKVLIVEDDNLARKGLILTAPWGQFDMRVVGEANSGERALEFLLKHPVDLLLTDLAMPVMSGIELMRIVRQRYPRLLCAVLTFHQDFEFVQEAIRLGAIDYIAKVQLEKERFEEVLGRIRERFLREQRKSSDAEPDAGDDEAFVVDQGYALLCVEDDPWAAWIRDALDDQANRPREIGSGVWFCAAENGHDRQREFDVLGRAVAQREGWTALRLTGLLGERRGRVLHVLRTYRQTGFYYDFDPDNRVVTMALQDLEAAPSPPPGAALEALKESWLSFDWIHDEERFRTLAEEMRRARLPHATLSQILGAIETGWNRIYSSLASRRISPPRPFCSWREVLEWLGRERLSTLEATLRPPYARDVVDRVLHAVRMVHRELQRPLFARDVAKRLAMSRSYFCLCFKDIVGTPFNDYLRQVRLDAAKELLLHSDKPIYAIAEATGYTDEKYFSRIFRDSAGMAPSDYRLKESRGGRSSET